MDNQTWRKKPRKFAPKSRLGCKTCKYARLVSSTIMERRVIQACRLQTFEADGSRTRRIKCDLSRPSCLKCLSTGRTCDGYAETSLPKSSDISIHTSNRSLKQLGKRFDQQSNTTVIAKRSNETSSITFSQSLGPLMILPVSGSTEAQAICFFQHISIKNVNEYRPCQSWRRALLRFSQTILPVRQAAIALAMIQRQSLDYRARCQEQQTSRRQDVRLYHAPLIHYNRAIQLLLDRHSGDSLDDLAVTLLVCYMFTCFEHLMGNHVQALKHLRGGVELSRNIDNPTRGNYVHLDARSLGVHAIIYQATTQIRRLDMQAGMILLDWNPTNFDLTSLSKSALFCNTFWSLDQAADELQVLVTQVMRLWNAEQQTRQLPSISEVSSSLKDSVLGELEKWSSLFEALLEQGNNSHPVTEFDSLVPLLRLQYTTAWILVSSFGPDQEMNYDSFLPQFQQCIALVKQVAIAHQQYSESSRSTFTPELGFLPILYIIGVKCRHPILRREVLTILRQQVVRESAWNSMSTARVVGRVIEIEEATVSQGQVLSMEQVPFWHRIDSLSFTHAPSGCFVTTVDIAYTFFSREGIHHESLEVA